MTTRMAIGLIFVAALTLAIALALQKPPGPERRLLTYTERVRGALFAELRPVHLTNCTLERFGERHDGGYALCGNLLGQVEAAYSYGIGGYDRWGCDASRRLGVRVHQYDCFNLDRPACPGGQPVFHEACVAGALSRDDAGRVFDTIEAHTVANGDGAKRLVVKIDVEGAEWDALRLAPAALLERIDQMTVEFHGVNDATYLETVWHLQRFFHVAHRHFNNFSCQDGLAPFPAWAYEVLLVNKRIGVLAPTSAAADEGPRRVDAPNNPTDDDCQVITSRL